MKEIKEGMECGIGIEGAGKFKEDDIIVTFEIQSIKELLNYNYDQQLPFKRTDRVGQQIK
ncbi:MAG: hypothetical protein Ct9H90mP15_09280 [Candidatus Neomarinimicrobiota bacterium]|nr:MAG: hypothetical protein Ct9H90mP15_09280 [Candidatus Neomarinimicrobiota bacterium]